MATSLKVVVVLVVLFVGLGSSVSLFPYTAKIGHQTVVWPEQYPGFCLYPNYPHGGFVKPNHNISFCIPKVDFMSLANTSIFLDTAGSAEPGDGLINYTIPEPGPENWNVSITNQTEEFGWIKLSFQTVVGPIQFTAHFWLVYINTTATLGNLYNHTVTIPIEAGSFKFGYEFIRLAEPGSPFAPEASSHENYIALSITLVSSDPLVNDDYYNPINGTLRTINFETEKASVVFDSPCLWMLDNTHLAEVNFNYLFDNATQFHVIWYEPRFNQTLFYDPSFSISMLISGDDYSSSSNANSGNNAGAGTGLATGGKSTSGGMSKGAIAGIVVGVFAGVCIIIIIGAIVVAVFSWWNRKRVRSAIHNSMQLDITN